MTTLMMDVRRCGRKWITSIEMKYKYREFGHHQI
jgi:hypothetical protein